MKELKITVDTNLIIYLFDNESEKGNLIKSCQMFKSILDYQKYLRIDLKISTATEEDLMQDAQETRRESILIRIRNIFQQISPGEFILDSKKALPRLHKDRNLFLEIQRILFPNLDSSSSDYKNNLNDLKHIFSHVKAGRDVYVTNDKNFLKDSKRSSLKNININIMSTEELVDYLESFGQKDTYQYKEAPVRHDYRNSKLKGEGELDFTNNNGLYVIGNGDFIFEIKWGECSQERMRVYKDPRTIHAIALAEDKKMKEVKSDKYLDFTDRCREPRRKKDVLVLKNSKGYFAAVVIDDFNVKSRGGNKNFLKFKYKINTSGNCDFSNLIS